MRRESADVISGLIGDIYDCVLQPSHWKHVLERLCDELDLKQGVLGLYRPETGEPLLRVQHGMTREWYDLMPSYGPESTEFWGGLERVGGYPVGELIIHSHAYPDYKPKGNRFALEWVRPQGIEDFAAMTVTNEPSGMGTLVFTSTRKLETSNEDELELLRLLSPHIRRAITISRVLDFRTYQQINLQRVADSFPNGVIVISGAREILYANAAAEKSLRANDALRVAGGQLTMRDERLDAALAAAIVACQSDDHMSERGCGIPARGSSGHRNLLYVLPLNHGRLKHSAHTGAVAAVFVAADGPPSPLPEGALAILYDLTPAEVRVCDLLLAGSAPTEISQQIGVAVSTVRTHLLRIFEKTGVNRQADLIRHIAPLMMRSL